MSVLDHTTNFRDVYRAYCGKTEIPLQYNEWCCLALLGAAVQDRVWLEKFRGFKMVPNMYIMMVGPSASGKDAATDLAENLTDHVPQLGQLRGSITGPGLLDWLGKEHPDRSGHIVRPPQTAKVWLMTPELGMAVGVGEIANKFIKTMTALYGRSSHFLDGTRTSGLVSVQDRCINWLSGSTRDWLVESVPRTAMNSGFMARICVVEGYDVMERIGVPQYEPDHYELIAWLKRRLAILASPAFGGEAILTGEARDVRLSWYHNRPEPPRGDEAAMAAWKREDDLMLKIAMILSVAERLDLKVTADHIREAQRLATAAHYMMPKLTRIAGETRVTTGVEKIREILKREGHMQHSALLRRMAGGYGVDAKRFRDLMGTLIQSGEVTSDRHGGAEMYVWKRRRVGGPNGGPPVEEWQVGDSDGNEDTAAEDQPE
jgi:hypothetical protein